MYNTILLLFFVAPPILSQLYFPESPEIGSASRVPSNQNVNYNAPSSNANTNYNTQSSNANTNYNTQNYNANQNQHAQQKPVIETRNGRINNIISKGINTMTLAIDRELTASQRQSSYGHEQNVIFSPVSLTGALALLLLGAAGRTFDEIANFLGLASGVDISSNPQFIHDQLGRLLSNLDQRGANYYGPRASFASGIFVQNTFPIRDQYKQTSINVYRSEVVNVDFQKEAARAQNQINKWVSDRTHGKIRDILPSAPQYSTEMIIVSALYFRGEWQYPFMTETTQRRPFYPYGLNAGRSVMVNMMANAGDFMYHKDAQLDCEIIALPYKGNTTNMYIVIPSDSSIDKLRNLEDRLSADHLERMISRMELTEIILVMPKMTLTSTISLKDTFSRLGVQSLFNPRDANLALISAGRSSNSNPVRQNSQHANVRPQTTTQRYQAPTNQARQTTKKYQPPVVQQAYQPQTTQRYQQPVQVRTTTQRYQQEQVYQQPTTQRYQQPVNQARQTTKRYQPETVYQQQTTPRYQQQQPVNQARQTTERYQPVEQPRRPQNTERYQPPVIQVYQEPTTQRYQQPVYQTSDVQQNNQNPTNIVYQIPVITGNRPAEQSYQIQSSVVEQAYVIQNGNRRPVEQTYQQPTTQRQQPNQDIPIVFTRYSTDENLNCADGFYANNSINCVRADSVRPATVNQKYDPYVRNIRGKRQVSNRQQQIQTLDELRRYLSTQNERNYNPGLYADEILHKVYIDISETGTEAAAATSVSISRDGSKTTFRVNVPFLFFIRHEDTKLNLFWGTVNVPTPHFN